MVLLTRRDIPHLARPHLAGPRAAGDGHPADSLVPTRRGLGLALFDLALLLPPCSPGGEPLGRGVVTLLESAGFRTVLISAPPDTNPGPDRALQDMLRETRGVLVLCEQGASSRGPGHWLAWMLGHAAALSRRTALLPVMRRDPLRPLWKLPYPLRGLPYAGTARAVGDQESSFWVLPADKPLESREALNLDYWLHMR
jgi:hypothetical protein